MILSNTVVYAIACLRYFALHPYEYHLAQKVACSGGVPYSYCRKILGKLARSGWVSSVKHRGFILSANPASITVASVIQALENNGNGKEAAPAQAEKLRTQFFSQYRNLELEEQLNHLTIAEIIANENGGDPGNAAPGARP